MNTGESDINKLIRSMDPELLMGTYVFVTMTKDRLKELDFNIVYSMIKEKEGISLILEKDDADTLGLPYHGEWAWISLNIHSALDAVGLTAAISNAFTKYDLSCNVVAGYHHDHIFVPFEKSTLALQILEQLSEQ